MRNRKNIKKNSGITIIALVITIVVLLILAGISITSFVGDKGLFNETRDMKDNIEDLQNQTIDDLHSIANELASSGGGAVDPDTPDQPETSTIPEGLEVGSSVTYNLIGNEYEWDNEYASSDQTGTVTLSSKTGEKFRITDYKVLAINKTTEEVTLVPAKLASGTEPKVRLQGAQGYNNAVKLLNDACSRLYGNEEKGIKARSIKIEDIEYYMENEAKNGTNGIYKSTYLGVSYGQQIDTAYTPVYRDIRYPVIYKKERGAVIDGIVQEDATLGVSDTLTNFIKRSEGTSTQNIYDVGAITTKGSIQPRLTYWDKDKAFMQTAFQEYTKKDNTKISYYSLIIPEEYTTSYCWIASRCIVVGPETCNFSIWGYGSNGTNVYALCNAAGAYLDSSYFLFPVITLNSKLLEASANGNFSVNLSR